MLFHKVGWTSRKRQQTAEIPRLRVPLVDPQVEADCPGDVTRVTFSDLGELSLEPKTTRYSCFHTLCRAPRDKKTDFDMLVECPFKSKTLAPYSVHKDSNPHTPVAKRRTGPPPPPPTFQMRK